MKSLFQPELKWYKGNLHVHTTRSDGRLEPQDMAAEYAAAGYDFVAVTDHDIDYPMHGGQTPLLLDGIEFGYDFQGETVHIVGVGFDKKPAHGLTPQDGIDAIRAAGGIAILAHPAWSMNSTATICALNGFAAAEVHNTVSAHLPMNARRSDSGALLDCALAKGARFGLVASDDAHFYDGDACVAATYVNADTLDAASLLNALREGRYFASTGPRFVDIRFDGSTIEVDCTPCRAICALSNLPWAGQRAAVGEGLTTFYYDIRPGERFVRIELEDEQGRHAWSNPIFV